MAGKVTTDGSRDAALLTSDELFTDWIAVDDAVAGAVDTAGFVETA
jgi:hypothetical protein